MTTLTQFKIDMTQYVMYGNAPRYYINDVMQEVIESENPEKSLKKFNNLSVFFKGLQKLIPTHEENGELIQWAADAPPKRVQELINTLGRLFPQNVKTLVTIGVLAIGGFFVSKQWDQS